MTRAQTPLGLTAVAYWEIIMGSLGLVFSLALLALGAFLTYGMLIVSSFMLMWLISGFSIVTEKPWAWKLAMISSTISLIGSLTLWILAFLFLEFFGLGVFIWAPIMFYLSRPNVKNFLSNPAGAT